MLVSIEFEADEIPHASPTPWYTLSRCQGASHRTEWQIEISKLPHSTEKWMPLFQALQFTITVHKSQDKDFESCYIISLSREVIAVTMVVFELLLYSLSVNSFMDLCG